MTAKLMRKAISSSTIPRPRSYAVIPPPRATGSQSFSNLGKKRFAQVRDDRTFDGVWFDSGSPLSSVQPQSHSTSDVKPPSERTLKLGKTIQVLHDRLPELLAKPLPQEILSPQITLHLFPSTHPHLPTVSGKIAYNAALWTAPVAWGRVPVVGNVRLIILSERMIKNDSFNSYTGSTGNEKLVVRWRTCGKTQGRGMGALYRGIYGGGDQVDKITEILGGDARDDEEFEGLFLFQFDEQGRIVKHVIEHAQEGRNWETKLRVVSVTDWLLGLAKGKREEPQLALGFCEEVEGDVRRKLVERSGRQGGEESLAR